MKINNESQGHPYIPALNA